MFHVSKRFTFEAAHTLSRQVDARASARIHGHSYTAIVTIQGDRLDQEGMVMDVGALSGVIQAVAQDLDHMFLNEVAGLEEPTLERLCVWIWNRLAVALPLYSVRVERRTEGDACVYFGHPPA